MRTQAKAFSCCISRFQGDRFRSLTYMATKWQQPCFHESFYKAFVKHLKESQQKAIVYFVWNQTLTIHIKNANSSLELRQKLLQQYWCRNLFTKLENYWKSWQLFLFHKFKLKVAKCDTNKVQIYISKLDCEIFKQNFRNCRSSTVSLAALSTELFVLFENVSREALKGFKKDPCVNKDWI